MTGANELRSLFVAAYGPDVELVRDEVREKDGARYWLAHVRPRRAGEVVFRHTFETPGGGYPFDDHEMRLFVGEAGERRELRADLRPQRVSIGDLVVVPFHIGPGLRRHAFRTDSRFPTYYFSAFPAALDERPLSTGETTVRAAGGPGVLRYLGRTASSSVHRGGGRASVGFTAYFEAIGAGRLNLELTPRRDDPVGGAPQAAAGVTRSIVVVPPGAPIATVMAEESIHQKIDDSPEPRVTSSGGTSYPVGVIMLRPGDRFALTYGQVVIPTRGDALDDAGRVEPIIRSGAFRVDPTVGFTGWLPLDAAPAQAPAEPPYLRWSFTEVPMPDGPDCWYHQDTVSWIGPGGATLWERRVPERMRRAQAGIGKAEVEGYRRFPRDTHGLAFLVGLLDLGDAVAIADATGLIVLAKTDGAVLLDAETPAPGAAEADRLWFDRGTYTVTARSGEAACSGEARGARFLAACGSRLVLFDGSALVTFSKEPLRVRSLVRFDSASHRLGTPGRVSAALAVDGLEVRLEGVVYLR